MRDNSKERPQRYFSLAVKDREADVYIFGYIVTPDWKAIDEMWGIEGDRSGFDFAQEVRGLDVDVINVHINSYGGHVSEGLAIHNVLVEHAAKIRTINDGFACSAASVVFMAGDERIMHAASLLMIHNASNRAEGNADDLRKAADNLDAISATAAEAYKAKITIADEELSKLLKNETWIVPADALKWGFATEVWKTSQTDKPAASAMDAIMRCMTAPPPQTVEVRIMDLDEVNELIKDLAAIKAAVSLPAGEAPPVVPVSPMEFFSALLGGKEK